MICPRCGTTTPAGTTRCATCAVDLVATAAPEGEDRAEWVELVTVYRATDPSELEVVHANFGGCSVDRHGALLDEFVVAAQSAFGAALRSVVVYGSAAEGRMRATSMTRS